MAKTNKRVFMFSKDNKKGIIKIYQDIGDTYWDEIGAEEFSRELDSLGDVNEIDVRINSHGGEVAAATAIYNQLRTHKAVINTYVDGIAASAASLIFMAGDNRYMMETSILMIHNPSSYGGGTSKELRGIADYLDKLKEAVMGAYKRADISEDEISNLMDNESWLTGSEALEMGFATNIDTFGDEIKIEVLEDTLMIGKVRMDISNSKGYKKFYMKHNKNSKIKKEGTPEMTYEEFQKQHPEMFKKAKMQGAEEERKRIQEIEELALPGTEVIMKKYKFEDPQSAAFVGIEVVKMVKKGDIKANEDEDKRTPEMIALEKAKLDAKDSGVNDIPPGKEQKTKAEMSKERAERMAAKINKNRGF